VNPDTWGPPSNVDARRRVQVVKGLPPNFVDICLALGFTPPDTVVYAWEDRVYSPSGAELPPELEVHESVHFDQQAAQGGAEMWWAKYLRDPAFRLEQEVEAYRAQIASLPTRDLRRACRRRVSKDLARLYALPITWQQADAFLLGHSMSMATSLRST